VKTSSLALLAVGAILLAGCAAERQKMEKPTMASDYSGVIQPTSPVRVNADEFNSVINDPNVVILDVRTPAEFAQGHIEDAVNLDVSVIDDFALQAGLLDKSKTYAVYCRSGNRSQVAVNTMFSRGINGIYELETGILGWEESGYPVTQ
jgi:phage shock protein E